MAFMSRLTTTWWTRAAAAADRRQRLRVRDEPDPVLAGVALTMFTDDSMPGFRSTSFHSPSSTRAKSRRSLTIRSIRRRPSRVRSMSRGRFSRV